MPLEHPGKEKCAEAPRRLWKIGVLKPNAESPRAKREAELRKVAEHIRRRLEKVRKLVLLNTDLEKEKQHFRLMRRCLRSRLQKGEMARTDFENELKDTEETLNTLQKKWKALKAGMQ